MMDDREEVIKALQFALDGMAFTGWGIAQVHKETVISTLELLKEQEPQPAIIEGSNVAQIGRCPSCNVVLLPWGANYCYKCGQAVKWDD